MAHYPSTSGIILDGVLIECGKNPEKIGPKLDTFNCETLLAEANRCLENFMLANFAGCIEKQSMYADGLTEDEIIENLSFDYNSPYKFARSKLYLWLAKVILIDNSCRLKNCFEKNRLTCRLVLLWQYLLNEPAIELKKFLDELEDVPLLENSVPKALIAETLIERMYAYLMFNQISKAEKCLTNALAIIDVKIEVTGTLGRRTRFQENLIPQLIAKATNGGGDGENVTDDTCDDVNNLPPNVLLRDDSLLETVCIAAEDGASSGGAKLSPLSLACMLASGVFERKIQSTDEMLVEKCCAYLDEVISQRRNWAIQVSALLQRCIFEKTRTRRVERACMQLETLSKLMNGVEVKEVDECNRRERLKLLLASGLKPFWYVDALHAEILRSVGCTAEALVIYEKQKDWDSVIDCYQSLGQLEKAEQLVRDLIAKHEKEPTYWCLLGDIIHEPNAYEKAIEVSNGRSFRAHRSLGMLMLQRKHYDVSYEHLKRSLELQPINASAWFNFGCCAWKLEKWDEAAKAYRECVRYEPAHFQAWNNLAAVYEKLNDAEKAKRLLQEALKLNFEHLKMRENYMLLCVRTHDIPSAVTAFHALLDLNKQYKDDATIETLTRKLVMLKEEDEKYAKSLIVKMCELLGRITSQQTSSSTVWRCYAELKRPGPESSTNEYDVYVKLLERVFRMSHNKQDWHKNEDSCVEVLDAVEKLVKARKKLAKMKNNDDTLVGEIESEIRMTLLPIIVSVEKAYGLDAAEASSNRLKEYLTKVKALSFTS